MYRVFFFVNKNINSESNFWLFERYQEEQAVLML